MTYKQNLSVLSEDRSRKMLHLTAKFAPGDYYYYRN
jgi:hypothetical protein